MIFTKEQRTEISRIIRKSYKAITLPVYKCLARGLKRVTSYAFACCMKAEWCVEPPEYFDHEYDLYYLWEKTGASHWLERGVYNTLAIQQFKEPILVELCCGDGFNAEFFYAKLCKNVYACDYNKEAIAFANKRKNVLM